MSYAFSSVSVYFHHIDEYSMNNVKIRLMEDNFKQGYVKYEILCSIKDSKTLFKVMHGQHPVQVLHHSQPNFIEKIVDCDFIIFKISTNIFDEVALTARKVYAALENWANEQGKASPRSEDDESPPRKHVILISTPLTWALTLPNTAAGPDRQKGYLYEDDYRRRQAHPSYNKHKLLERDTVWLQNRCKNFVRTLVICPGVTYGRKNNVFHYIFKLAYYNKQVPIVRPGTQLIPLVYLADFVEMMKKIIDHFPPPEHRFIFISQPVMIPFKRFTYNICRAMNGDCSKIRYVDGSDLRKMDRSLFTNYVLDVITLSIRLAPTYFKNYPFHEVTDSLWNELVTTFKQARALRPVKIVIAGPPLVGKTEHATRLAEYFQVHYIEIRDLLYLYINHLKVKIADSIIVIDSLECPSQSYLEFDKEGEEDEIIAKKASSECKGKSVPPRKFDADDEYLLKELKYRIELWSAELQELKTYVASLKKFADWDFDHISRCLISLLSIPSYNDNQGYVLDGFPFTLEQANEIFYNTRKIDLPDSEELDEERDPHAGITIPPLPSPLVPTNFVMLDASDDLLRKRAMGIPETEAMARRCLRHQMLPRLDCHRLLYEGPFGLLNLFYDHHLIPINILVEPNTYLADTVQLLKSEIGQPYIYLPTEEEQEAANKVIAEKKAKEEETERLRKEELIRSLTLDRERKHLEWNKKYEEVQKRERELREQRTLPLRQYLRKHIIPALTPGILRATEVKPDDPVDFLSDYLYKCSTEEQRMQPFCSDEERKRYFRFFYEELSRESEYKFDVKTIGL